MAELTKIFENIPTIWVMIIVVVMYKISAFIIKKSFPILWDKYFPTKETTKSNDFQQPIGVEYMNDIKKSIEKLGDKITDLIIATEIGEKTHKVLETGINDIKKSHYHYEKRLDEIEDRVLILESKGA